MRYLRFILLFVLLLPLFLSCNKDFDVNAPWQDITVVYGLLDQTQDTTFIKITKAFLGPGNAMEFAKVPDSSIYPGKLEVRLIEYNGEDSVASFVCDTITIHNKKAGDSIFYYPDQLMYYTLAPLNEEHNYKLYIRNRQTGKVVTGRTNLIRDFEIQKPQVTANFVPGKNFEVKWNPAHNGKRYQLTIRFFYQEWPTGHEEQKVMKYIDWIVFNNIRSIDPNSIQPFDEWFSGNGFFSAVSHKIDTTSVLTRWAHHCRCIFTVGTEDLNTYMEVTEPSNSLVQEKPAFTNIVNGIGLFAARYTNISDTISLSVQTKSYLKTDPLTMHRGF